MATKILDEIKKSFDKGSRLELTLFEGTEYYGGWTDAPTVNPIGYDPCESMTDKPGLKVVGYITEFRYSEHFQRTRIFLSPVWNPAENRKSYEFSSLYVDEACIHSFSK